MRRRHRVSDLLKCPFCDVEGFDKPGLANHLTFDCERMQVCLECFRDERNQALKVHQANTAARVESVLGDSVICGRCNATLKTFAEACTAGLDDQCPGFLTIERARSQAGAK